MRLKSSLLLVALLIAHACPPQAQAQEKIGVVDLSMVFEKYYKTPLAVAKIEARKAELEAEINTLIEQLRADESAYRDVEALAKDLSASADEIADRKSRAAQLLRNLQEKRSAIEVRIKQSEEIIQEQGQRMNARLLEEIRTEIQAVAGQQNYFLVVNKSARDAGNAPLFPFHNGGNDITKQVLSNLNAGELAR